MNRIYRNKLFLLLLHSLNRKEVKRFLKATTRDQVLTLSEIILNILEGNLPLSEESIKSLSKFKNVLRRIGSFSINITNKRKLLIFHSTLIHFILQLLWPEISSIIETESEGEEDKEEEEEEEEETSSRK